MARYITSISKNAKFNHFLSDKAVEAAASGRRVLVVGDRVEQLQYLRKRILEKSSGVSAGLYVGSVDKRRLTKEQLEVAKGCDVVLATYGMMAEGTDIPALDTLFLATPRTDVEQVVGRIQRHCEGKKSLLIVDPYFNTNFNRRMADKRKKIYERLDFTNQRNQPC